MPYSVLYVARMMLLFQCLVLLAGTLTVLTTKFKSKIKLQIIPLYAPYLNQKNLATSTKHEQV